jgi:DNA-binding YbaB/EbfC family protein
MTINPMELLKNASALKEQFSQIQDSLTDITATGSSGGNMVRITLNGKFELIDIELDQIAVDNRDVPMLQDLILAAYHDAQSKLQDEMKQKLGPALGAAGLGL